MFMAVSGNSILIADDGATSAMGKRINQLVGRFACDGFCFALTLENQLTRRGLLNSVSDDDIVSIHRTVNDAYTELRRANIVSEGEIDQFVRQWTGAECQRRFGPLVESPRRIASRESTKRRLDELIDKLQQESPDEKAQRAEHARRVREADPYCQWRDALTARMERLLQGQCPTSVEMDIDADLEALNRTCGCRQLYVDACVISFHHKFDELGRDAFDAYFAAMWESKLPSHYETVLVTIGGHLEMMRRLGVDPQCVFDHVVEVTLPLS
jgi:hypothetical protein